MTGTSEHAAGSAAEDAVEVTGRIVAQATSATAAAERLRREAAGQWSPVGPAAVCGANGPDGPASDVAIRFVDMPLMVRAAWVPDQRVCLIDAALDPAGRLEALQELHAALIRTGHAA